LSWFYGFVGGVIFGYWVLDLIVYGVVEMDENGCVIFLVEKLFEFWSNYVVLGLYFYDNDVVEIVCNLKFFFCGELEIIDVNLIYFERGDFQVSVLSRGMVWLDTGTFDLLYDAVSYVRTIESWEGCKIGVFEEVVWCNGFFFGYGTGCSRRVAREEWLWVVFSGFAGGGC